VSFSADVKEEMAGKTDRARHCRLAFLAGLMAFMPVPRESEADRRRREECAPGAAEPLLRTENRLAAEAFCRVLEKTFDLSAGLTPEHSGALAVYAGTEAERQQVISALHLDSGTEITDARLLRQPCCRRAFLRGAFLAAGSVSDPLRSYHLEIVCRSAAQAHQLEEILHSFGLDGRCIERKRREGGRMRYVVYLKEAEQIADALNVCGASRGVLEMENARIVRDVRGSVNRRVNCETANIGKTVSAAVRQTEAIEYLRANVGFENLPESLREAAALRLEWPELPYAELGKLFSPPVGKSGVSHRLRRLEEMADRLQAGGRA